MHALFLIAKENFRDEELFEPKKILETAGIKTTITSIESGLAKGSRGGTTTIDLPIRDVHIEDYDILIAIGGPGSPALGDYEEVLDLIRKAHSLGKPLAAICIAPYLLARWKLDYSRRPNVGKRLRTRDYQAVKRVASSTRNNCIFIDLAPQKDY